MKFVDALRMCGRVFDILKFEIFKILEKDIASGFVGVSLSPVVHARHHRRYHFRCSPHCRCCQSWRYLLQLRWRAGAGTESATMASGRKGGRENVVPCSIHGYAMWKPRDTERRTDRHGPGESPPCGRWRRRDVFSSLEAIAEHALDAQYSFRSTHVVRSFVRSS